jgi:hypothetical protein
MSLSTAEARPAPRAWVRVVIGVLLAGLVVMWVYAFVFASKEGAYFVTDSAWRDAAQARCQEAVDERVALADDRGGRITDPTPEQLRTRADVVDAATATLDDMLDDIEARGVDGERNRIRVNQWLGFYRTLVADRRAYTARLRQLRNEPFTETEVGSGPVGSVLIDFATGNDIKACLPPGDLGQS